MFIMLANSKCYQIGIHFFGLACITESCQEITNTSETAKVLGWTLTLTCCFFKREVLVSKKLSP